MSWEKVVLITRKTRLEALIERFNTRGQAKFYLEHAGADYADYAQEDDAYRAALDRTRRAVELGLKVHVVERGLVPTVNFGLGDLVVCVGQDGLVANCAKYAGEQPIVAVNPEPARFDGVLLPFRPEGVRPALEGVLAGRARLRRVTLAEARLNDGQRLLAFNDLFIGARTHVSARYRLSAAGRREAQSSSGLIVSTGAGSTGWLSSVFNMAAGVARLAGGTPGSGLTWDWSERKLAYVVREPFASRHSGAGLAAGWLGAGERMTIESQMPSSGVIFSDGVESDFLEFNAGAIAEIGIAERQACLVA
ncbi:MAG: NAD+ kinase [Elusimicrobia bacterium]|nr:NAD+ kinase [Elusimicrobiota bacterium]